MEELKPINTGNARTINENCSPILRLRNIMIYLSCQFLGITK